MDFSKNIHQHNRKLLNKSLQEKLLLKMPCLASGNHKVLHGHGYRLLHNIRLFSFLERPQEVAVGLSFLPRNLIRWIMQSTLILLDPAHVMQCKILPGISAGCHTHWGPSQLLHAEGHFQQLLHIPAESRYRRGRAKTWCTSVSGYLQVILIYYYMHMWYKYAYTYIYISLVYFSPPAF